MAKKIEQEIKELDKQVDFIIKYRNKIIIFVGICLLITWFTILF